MCYSFLDKRGGYIKRSIKWHLYNNQELVIEKDNIECEFEDNIISYYEDNYINRVIINKKIFERENDDYKLTIDLDNSKMNYLLKESNKILETDIYGSFFNENNIIRISYNIEDDNFELFIEYKG